MSFYADITNESTSVTQGNDGIVVKKCLSELRGGRTLDTTDFTPEVIREGHVVIKETATGKYKPMPATDGVSGAVATLGSVTAGSSYTNGTYENVPMKGGTGEGCLCTVVVALTVVSTVTVTKKGKNYTAGDVLSADAAYIGGTGSGFSVPVSTVEDVAAAYGSLPSGHTYQGVVKSTVSTKKPFVGVMVAGEYNPTAAPFNFSTIASAFKTAVPAILQIAD